jgi:FtsP/CotA-like multicopper oxidase with cupredoxin domain
MRSTILLGAVVAAVATGCSSGGGVQVRTSVPIRGEVKVVIPFTNPTIVGRFVYHCHILAHEDKGMMATIEVTP